MRFPDDVPTLADGDVTLRAHRVEDIPAAVEQCVDPVSIQWTTVPLGYTEDDARRFLTEIMPKGWTDESELGFAIETTHPDGQRRYSGTISLRDEGERRAEIAFGAHPAIRGRGVMSTAVRLILDWGFGSRNLETVLWQANRGNVASRRVAWKAGFTFGGTVRRWLNHRGEYPDAWVASLHRDDNRDPKSAWRDTPVIAGERVVLRPLRPSDAQRIVEGISDPLTRRFIPQLPDPFEPAHALDYQARVVEQTSLGTCLMWAMADPRTDQHLGNMGLPRMTAREGEIGYWTHPDARGRGTTSEAVRMVIRHSLLDEDDGGAGLQRVFLKTAATNAASQRIALGNAMTQCGRERGAERLGDGSTDDLLVFDLLRDEWLAGEGNTGRHG